MSDANGAKPGTARTPQVPTTVFASMLTPVVAEDEPEAATSVPAPKQAAPEVAPDRGSEPTQRPARSTTAATSKAPERSVKSAAAPRAAASTPTREEQRSVADKGVQVSLPASIDARLQKYWRGTGLSHPQILFTAIESVYDRLPELVSSTVAQPSAGPTLFNRPPAVVRRHDEGEARNTFVIRITEENKATIDALWTEVGAPSRNAMLIAAYDAFLPND